MEGSRTKNTIQNVKTGAIVQIVNKIMAFVVRTVFIKMLNTEYLGVNGLFTNVLTILSFAELGIGTAIIFNMYKPVAENDKEKIKSLMDLYRKSYNMIGILVFVLGLFVIPFMNIIVKDAPNIKENLVITKLDDNFIDIQLKKLNIPKKEVVFLSINSNGKMYIQPENGKFQIVQTNYKGDGNW